MTGLNAEEAVMAVLSNPASAQRVNDRTVAPDNTEPFTADNPGRAIGRFAAAYEAQRQALESRAAEPGPPSPIPFKPPTRG